MIRENFALNIYIKKEEKSKMNSLIFYLKSLVSCLLLPVGLVDFFSEPMASCAYTQLRSASVSLLYPLWTVWSWPDIFTCVSHVILTSALDLDIFAHYYRKGDWGTDQWCFQDHTANDRLRIQVQVQGTLLSKFIHSLSSWPWEKELSYYEMNWNHHEQ